MKDESVKIINDDLLLGLGLKRNNKSITGEAITDYGEEKRPKFLKSCPAPPFLLKSHLYAKNQEKEKEKEKPKNCRRFSSSPIGLRRRLNLPSLRRWWC